ncbi:hypothetical protein [Halorhodospira halochloris]|uniref:hypothetical protein n=1 Tax=Halorhodospira halochloris TaxID=1052 RepID=UPI001EE81562|nr:hypothetical protein [Halorhodospira halochloris]MCG5547239.1 hypothetical protein [Halorhodospira halochloris]
MRLRLHCTAIAVTFYALCAPTLAIASGNESQPRSHSFVQAGLGKAFFDRTLAAFPGGEKPQNENGDDAPEPITYRRTLGVNLRASWQAEHGTFFFFDYFGSEGCVDDCYRDDSAEGTSTALERYFYGAGFNLPVSEQIDLYATASRERHTFERCHDTDDRDEQCTTDQRRGYTIGAGATAQISATWSLASHYERYFGLSDDDGLQKLGNGRLTTRLEAALDDGKRSRAYVEYLFERNRSVRIGFRFYY